MADTSYLRLCRLSFDGIRTGDTELRLDSCHFFTITTTTLSLSSQNRTSLITTANENFRREHQDE
jgi:hypothetical protein